MQFISVSDLEVLSGLSRWFVALDWGVWPVFILSVLLWASMRGGAGIQRGVRPVLTEVLYPVSSADMTVTRLWGYGIVVVGTWLAAFVLSNVGFFLGDEGLAWRIWRLSSDPDRGLVEPVLESCVYGDVWAPCKPFAADCVHHAEPVPACGCGIYAVTTRETALEWAHWAQSAPSRLGLAWSKATSFHIAPTR